MNKKWRIPYKKLGVIMGILFVIIMIFSAVILIKSNKTKETAIELEEICCSLQFYELDAKEWMEVLTDKVSHPLKVKDLNRILSILGIKEYVELPDTWKENHTLTRKQYYMVYDDILCLLDQEGRVKKQIIKINKKLRVTSQQGVICSETYIFRVGYGFDSYQEGESYEVYSMGMEILGYHQVEIVTKPIDLKDANIRVLLTFDEIYEWNPKDVNILLSGEFTLYFNEIKILDLKDETVCINRYLKAEELSIHASLNNRLELVPKDENCRFVLEYQGKLTNSYRGKICIYPKEQSCFFVNELPVEQYLYSVVPSEMPASYEFEALKAQAICARSYAYQHILYGGKMDYYAHVDDTIHYQVYNKTSEQEATNQAVDETYGIYLSYKGKLATTYYFSTSMGNTAGAAYWNLKNADFGYLKSVSKYGGLDLKKESAFREFIDDCPTDDYESDCKYYRWSANVKLDEKVIIERITERLKIDSDAVNKIPKSSWGKITSVYVKERDSSGGIKQLVLVYGKNETIINGEYNIRYCLGGSLLNLCLKNGEEAMAQLIPSAFFYIKSVQNDACEIVGGGYGHGIGMSQNGANGMAKQGYNHEEILDFYYKDCDLVQ